MFLDCKDGLSSSLISSHLAENQNAEVVDLKLIFWNLNSFFFCSTLAPLQVEVPVLPVRHLRARLLKNGSFQQGQQLQLPAEPNAPYCKISRGCTYT